MDLFCGIYGIGAVILIVGSRYFDKNNITLFLGGYAIGSIIEYLTSFLVEVIMQAKWWDYSNNILNVNGRVCLLYSAFWGILTIFLIRKFNPFIDSILDKIASKLSPKVIKGLLTAITLFLAFDCALTCYAQDIFITRMVIQNRIEVKDIRKKGKELSKITRKRLSYEFCKYPLG